ncbi:hypothetical protein B0H14DRAFT_2645622 [Mycena olivaceomarginata]|nr:hypothetical protein B0H14DRAFT_2645622 [Mycena olivaceomarginata]
MLKPRPSTEPTTLKLPVKRHDWRCRETRWGIDKEYCEVKRMRTYTERYGSAAPTNCYIPARKLGQAAAFLQLLSSSITIKIPDGLHAQVLSRHQIQLGGIKTPVARRAGIWCGMSGYSQAGAPLCLMFFLFFFLSIDSNFWVAERKPRPIWIIPAPRPSPSIFSALTRLKSGGFSVENTTKTRSTARLCRTRSQSKPAQGKCPRHQPEHDYEAQYDVGIMLTLKMCWDLTILFVEIERPYEFICSARALPYPPLPNLIYGHTIKEESPLPLIKLELSPHQPSRSSSQVVPAMPTPNSNSPNVSPVSGVSTQSSQPMNISVEEKQKALEGLSGLRSKSSKTAAPVKSKQKSSRDDDKEVDKPPGNVRRRHSDEVGKDDGNVLKRLKKRIEKGAQPAQSADCSPTPPPHPKPRPIFKGRKGCPPGVRAPVL